MERLHTALVQTHDGKAVKAQKTIANILNPGHIRASGHGPFKISADFLIGQIRPDVTDDGTHNGPSFLFADNGAATKKCDKKESAGESLPDDILVAF